MACGDQRMNAQLVDQLQVGPSKLTIVK